MKIHTSSENDIRMIRRVTLLYLVVASLWILFSDAILALFAPDIAVYSRLAIYKGWAFVLVTSSLLYLYLKPRTESLRRYQKALLQAKEELSESEMKYRDLLNGMSDTVWVIDFNSRLIDVNDAAVNVLGYSREELLTMGPADFDGTLSPEEIETLVKQMRKDRIQIFETIHVTKDGKRIPVEIKSGLVTYKGKEAILCIARDITERRQAQAEREAILSREQAMHNRMSAMFDRVTDGFVSFDLQMNYTFVNRRGGELLGRSPQDLLGKNYWQEYPEAKDTPFAKAYARALETQTLLHIEDYYAPWDRWFENRIYPSPDGLTIYFTEITERKHVEEKLKRRLDYELATVECMRLLLEPREMDTLLPGILERIHRTVGCSRSYIFQNETDPKLDICMSQIYEVVGEGVTKQIDNPLLKHLPYSEGSSTLLKTLQSRQHYAHLVEELDEPDRSILAEQGILSVLILPIFAGSKLWGFIGFDDCEKARMWHEDDIKLLGIVSDGIGETILRKTAEQELKESEERFKALHNASFGGIAIHDKGIILECNQGLAELTGYSVEELIGMDGLLLIAEGSRAAVRNDIASDLEEPCEAVGLRKDGTEYPIKVEAKNIPYRGKNVRVTEFRNITEQKEAEKSLMEAKMIAEESNRIKSEFLANMSHELRTPLTAIIGFSDILSMQKFGELNSKQLEFTDHILSSGKHLLELINDILDISKIEAGRMELYCEEFSFNALLDDVQRTLYPLAVRKNIEFSVTKDFRDPEIFADRFKIKQIMFNLLSNAIKFTPDNGKVSVTARRNGDTLEVSVSDTGIGIPADRLEDIFNPFTQVDASNKRKYGGTGLGLALVKRFVEMHNGSIRVESDEGKGSTFTFTLVDLNCSE